MSDSYIRLIPTDRDWQPTEHAAAAAVAYVAQLFCGPGDSVERVYCAFYDQVTIIDSGEYTVSITCSNCRTNIDLAWLGDIVRERGQSLTDLNVTVPCCGTALSLDALHYDNPIGFARFEVCAMNATRGIYELDGHELAKVADLLGHPVTQILAHY